jgi:hypothetical protein
VLERVADRTGDARAARDLGEHRLEPGPQIFDERRGLGQASGTALVGRSAADRALDAEERADARQRWLIASQRQQVNFSRTCCTTFHWRGITSSVSPRRSGARSLRVAPVDPFEHVAELGRPDRDHPIGRRWPDETPALQPLGVERQPELRRATAP